MEMFAIWSGKGQVIAVIQQKVDSIVININAKAVIRMTDPQMSLALIK